MANNLQASFQNGQLVINEMMVQLNVTEKQGRQMLEEAFQKEAEKMAAKYTLEMLMKLTTFDATSLCSLLEIKDPNTVRGYFKLDKKDKRFLPTVDLGGKKLNRVRAVEVENWLIRNGKEELLAPLYGNVQNRIDKNK